MPHYADDSESATWLAERQARRLRALREVIEPIQADAGRPAGVSQSAWYRMENGISRVDPIALARFCAAYGVPAGWVISGDPAGLPPLILRALAEGVPELFGPDRTGAVSAGIAAPATRVPSGSLGGTRKGRKARARSVPS